MRITALVRTLVLWLVIVLVHELLTPHALQCLAILLIVTLFLDWVRPPNNVNLIALGNLWAALTIAVDAISRRALANEMIVFAGIAMSPLIGSRLRHLLRNVRVTRDTSAS